MTAPTLYGKPVMEQLITDVVKLHENEPDPKRRHKLEMLLVFYRWEAGKHDTVDATQAEADIERQDLGIPVRGA